MNQQERIKKISGLSDIKHIRYNQIISYYLLIIIGMGLYSFIMAGIGIICLILGYKLYAIFFIIAQYMGIFLVIRQAYSLRKQSEKFLYEN
jgi:hypothetical protein